MDERMKIEYRSAKLTKSALAPDVLRITITPFVDQLPEDAIGGSNRNDTAAHPLTLHWRELRVEADLPTYRNSRRPRGFLRHRGAFTKRFFEDSGAEIGDIVIFEQLTAHEFRLHLEKPDGRRVSGSIPSKIREDAIRRWAMRETRPEQQEFRRMIAERDGLLCAISGCEVAEILDAAHLLPRAAGGSYDPQNGVILRADLHRLFDAGLLRLDCRGKASIANDLMDPDYRRFDGVLARSSAGFSLIFAVESHS
jgi:hypothetical protein